MGFELRQENKANINQGPGGVQLLWDALPQPVTLPSNIQLDFDSTEEEPQLLLPTQQPLGRSRGRSPSPQGVAEQRMKGWGVASGSQLPSYIDAELELAMLRERD